MSILNCITTFIGKESKPTVAFQVVVSHSRMFMHVSKYFYGTWNDKLITVNDTFPVEVWQGERFKHMKFVLLNSRGVPVTYQGVWIAVDGGYQKLACFIDPMHNRFGFPEVVFSEWLESVRKDVECAFGILKIRFRFLRGFVVYQDADIIENAFKTAAMLHNMLLKHDGLDDFNWDNIDPDGDLQDDELIIPPTVEDNDVDVAPVQVPLDLMVHRPAYVRYSPDNYHLIREAIKDHFNYQYNRGYYNLFYLKIKGANIYVMFYDIGLVLWPKRFKDKLKTRFPSQRSAIVARLNDEHERVLYVQASTLRAYHPNTNVATRLIGNGLFSRIVIEKDGHIADYHGDIISNEEAELRDNAHHGGYMIYLNEDTKMDCFNNAMNNRCKASMSNSNTKVINTITGKGAIVNARIVVNKAPSGDWRVRLKATRKIPMHTEIITNYGSGFRYPSPHATEDSDVEEDEDIEVEEDEDSDVEEEEDSDVEEEK
jgi:hypothetical protein